MAFRILQKDDPVLRKIASEVSLSDVGGNKIKNVIKSMRQAMDAEEDAVAIAAPQIGELLRIFAVSGRATGLRGDVLRRRSLSEGKRGDGKDKKDKVEKEKKPDLIFINPAIIKTSKKKNKLEEGCLSVRWLYGEVPRAEKVTVRAFDEKGRVFERGASGLMAQIFQHEIDHLDGVLFIDKAENVKELTPRDGK